MVGNVALKYTLDISNSHPLPGIRVLPYNRLETQAFPSAFFLSMLKTHRGLFELIRIPEPRTIILVASFFTRPSLLKLADLAIIRPKIRIKSIPTPPTTRVYRSLRFHHAACSFSFRLVILRHGSNSDLVVRFAAVDAGIILGKVFFDSVLMFLKLADRRRPKA